MFKAVFIADSDNRVANAVAMSIIFDPKKLTVISIDTSRSFCQFYPENKFNNSAGAIKIECGSPSPGFKGENTIAEVTFMAKALGETSLKIDNTSQILLHDGKGTNIFSKPADYYITIVNSI
jgi:hypothetical protein